MKESEAKKKLCPHMKIDAAVGTVRQTTIRTCQGSDCMMWEAERKVESNKFNKNNVPDGWTAIGREQNGEVVICQRVIKPDSGDYGLKTKELYCEGCQ